MSDEAALVDALTLIGLRHTAANLDDLVALATKRRWGPTQLLEHVAETEQAVTQQIDYEDGALCVRFGFAAGSATYLSCKLDLLDLRRRHEELLAARSMP